MILLFRSILYPVHTWHDAGILLTVLGFGCIPATILIFAFRVTYFSLQKQEVRFKDRDNRKKQLI